MEEMQFGGAMGTDYDDQLILRIFPHHVGLYAAFGHQLNTRLKANFPGECLQIIEGGCGTGLSTQTILDSIQGERVLWSVDNEPLMLEKARTRLSHISELRFVESDVEGYLRTQPTGSVHGFATAFLLHNTDPAKRNAITKEAFRVLKPSGIFVNADRCGRDRRAEYFVNLSTQLQALSILLAMGRADQYEIWFEHLINDERRRFTEGEQRQILQVAGFTEITLHSRHQTECLFIAQKPFSPEH